MAVQGRFERNRRKIFGGSGENETSKKKVQKKKEKMQPMQREDGSYKRAENWKTAVNKVVSDLRSEAKGS